MPIYDRRDPDGYQPIDRWDGGLGWLAHYDEVGLRASHAVRGEDGGAWLVDPIDAPGIDQLVATVGPVSGVVVLSNWHARDAGAIARRHRVDVHLPAWMTRVEERLDAPVERFSGVAGESGLCVHRHQPLPGWREGIAYRESDGTLYVPESMGTAPGYVVGDERLGVAPVCRFSPPRDVLAGFEPERVLVGHGEGVMEGASSALAEALAGARRRLPRALLENGPTQLKSLVAALRE